MNIQATGILQWLIDSDDVPVLLLKGGGGSSKSYSVSQYIIDILCLQNTGLKIVVGRKYRPQLKITAQLSIQARLEELYQYGYRWYENKSDNYIKFRGNTIYFLQLEDVTKIQSVESHVVWLEEGTELDFQTFNHLFTRNRLKPKKRRNQTIITFNPIDIHNYIKTQIIDTNVIPHKIHHSTYLDNPFLNEESVKIYKMYEELDPHFYQIYTKGEWGVLTNIVYKNWDIVEKLPEKGDIYYGLDFGFINPCACVKVVENENDIYIQEVLYEKELTTPEIGARLEGIKQVIYPDPAEPDRIEELRKMGFYVEPAHKGQGSVNAGIDLLRHKKIHITKDSPNVIKEIQGYSYRELKDGTVIEEPIKVNDHAMDALRYAVTTRGRTSQPGIIMIDL